MRRPFALPARLARVSGRARASLLVGLGTLLLLGAVLALGLGLGTVNAQPMVTLSYSAFLAQVHADNVQVITLDTQTDDLTGTLRTPATDGQQTARHFRTMLYPYTADSALLQLLARHSVRVSSPAPESGGARLLEALLALLGLIGSGLLVGGVRSWRDDPSRVDEMSPPPVLRQKRQ